MSFKNKILGGFKKNIIFIVLILGAIFNDILLRKMTVGGISYWKPILTTIPMIIFISLLALFLSYRRRNYLYVTLSVFFGMLNGMNYIYYKHYSSFLSFSLLKQLSQVKGVADSVVKTLDLKVLLFFIPTIVLIVAIKKLKTKDFFVRAEQNRSRLEFLPPVVIGLVILTFVFTTLTNTDKSRIVKQWNRPYLVEQLGIYSYTTADFVKNIASSSVPEMKDEEATILLEDLVEKNINIKKENEYTNIFEGKDVYVIHYESAESFAMDQEFEDGPVTPFLNKMASEGLNFENFYTQHSVGTSSDSEFTFNTSLLPINNGTVFMTHADRDYVSMEKLLKDKGYYTMSMHGNNGDFWNRNIMHENLGYDRFFSKDDYNIDEEIGLGLSDVSFFNQSIQKIKQIKEEEQKPVLSTLITLSNHYPFDDVEKYPEFNVGHLEGTDIGNYLKSYHYADTALQSFVEGMDKEGLLDNAVIVLYGDHLAKISNSDYSKAFNYDKESGEYYTKEDPEYVAINGTFKKELTKTPFIIWSKDQKFSQTIDAPMGMVDALPTISNMLGIFNPYQIGQDMMSAKENNVVFPDGSWLNEKHYYSVSDSKLYSFESDRVIENPSLVVTNENIDKEIDLSNKIIQNDLIRFFNGLLAHQKVLTPQQRSIMYTEPVS